MSNVFLLLGMSQITDEFAIFIYRQRINTHYNVLKFVQIEIFIYIEREKIFLPCISGWIEEIAWLKVLGFQQRTYSFTN